MENKKSLAVLAVSVAVIAAVALLTYLNWGPEGTKQLANSTLNNTVTGFEKLAPASSYALEQDSATVAPPASKTDNSELTEAVKGMAQAVTALVGQGKEEVELGEESRKKISAGAMKDMESFSISKLAQQFDGDKKLAEAVLYVNGEAGDVGKYFGDILDRNNDKYMSGRNATSKLAMLNKEINDQQEVTMGDNSFATDTLVGIHLAGDKRFNDEERAALAKFTKKGREPIFLVTAAQSERDEYQKKINAVSAQAKKAQAQYDKLKGMYVDEDYSINVPMKTTKVWQ